MIKKNANENKELTDALYCEYLEELNANEEYKKMTDNEQYMYRIVNAEKISKEGPAILLSFCLSAISFASAGYFSDVKALYIGSLFSIGAFATLYKPLINDSKKYKTLTKAAREDKY